MQTTARSKTLLIPIVMAPLLVAGYLSAWQETSRSARMTGTSRRFRS
jgi:hypothetical protein